MLFNVHRFRQFAANQSKIWLTTAKDMSYDLTLKEMKTQRKNQELDMWAQKAPEVYCVFHQQFGSFYTQLFGPTTPLLHAVVVTTPIAILTGGFQVSGKDLININFCKLSPARCLRKIFYIGFTLSQCLQLFLRRIHFPWTPLTIGID
jgi:flagellar biosynthesis protein FlhB